MPGSAASETPCRMSMSNLTGFDDGMTVAKNSTACGIYPVFSWPKIFLVGQGLLFMKAS